MLACPRVEEFPGVEGFEEDLQDLGREDLGYSMMEWMADRAV